MEVSISFYLIFFLSLIFMIGSCKEKLTEEKQDVSLDEKNEVPRGDYSDNDTVFLSYKENGNMVNDTFIEKHSLSRVFLYKSSKLPSTRNQLNARGLGLTFSEFKSSDCLIDAQEGEYKTYLDSMSRTDSELYVKLSVVDNCAYSFLADIAEIDSTTIDLIYYSYGAVHAACNCRFSLEYRIALNQWGEKGVSDKINTVLVNGKSLNPMPRRTRAYLEKATKW